MSPSVFISEWAQHPNDQTHENIYILYKVCIFETFHLQKHHSSVVRHLLWSQGSIPGSVLLSEEKIDDAFCRLFCVVPLKSIATVAQGYWRMCAPHSKSSWRKVCRLKSVTVKTCRAAWQGFKLWPACESLWKQLHPQQFHDDVSGNYQWKMKKNFYNSHCLCSRWAI